VHIPDPVELMEARMDREIARVDAAGTYPCVYCGRRFDLETMHPISADPSAPGECGRADCSSATPSEDSK
jgi:hypothetical protein